MDVLSRIATWLSDHEATISAVAAIIVIAGVVFAGVRSLVRRRGEATQEKAPSAPVSEPASAAETSTSDLDPLTVPGFEGRPAIAVLAFDNLSGDPDQEYFADGIAEDLITRLSYQRVFPVIARNSSFTYKGKAVDVKEVGRDLGARFVVEGSVRKAGDSVRISAQLIDATSGAHVWAETYDRQLRDVFSVQDEISQAIVGSMHPELERLEQERAVRRDPETLDAWDCGMRGWWHLNKYGKDDNLAAQRLFERAIELDPHSSDAHAGLASTHLVDLQHHWTTAPAESTALLQRMARQAVVLDPHNATAQYVLAFAHGQAGQQDEMLRTLERSLELSPSSSAAHGSLGFTLALGGRHEEGIPRLEKAIRLDPRSHNLPFWSSAVAWAHFVAERYEEAAEWAKRSSRENPDYPYAYRVLAASYGQLGRLDDARRALQEELRLEPEISIAKVMNEPWNPYADPKFRQSYIEGLRKAGMPE